MGPRQPAIRAARPGPLEQILGYTFADPSLLQWALTHRSLAYEQAASEPAPGDSSPGDPRADNEQLEFLGDAVLGLVTADLLVTRFPGSREGELTRLRASLVSRRHLATVASRLSLGDHLRLGRGEERSGGREKPALLANSLEAILGAIFLDSRGTHNLDAVSAIVAREIVDPAMADLSLALAHGGALSGAAGDHKSALQEHLQAVGRGQPRYVLAEESGPDHRKLFRVEVHLAAESTGRDRILAVAEASSKKEAQQLAARLALVELAGPPGQAAPALAGGPGLAGSGLAGSSLADPGLASPGQAESLQTTLAPAIEDVA